MDGDAPGRGLLRRETEVARLHEAVSDAAAGHGSLVVVTGPAGIGKTALLRTVLDAAPGLGVRARHARGFELECSFPLGVVRQLLELPLAEATPDVRAELLTGAEAAAVALDPRAVSVPAGDLSFVVAHALCWLNANLPVRQPLALVVDDVHWADPASLRVLAHLAARLEDLPVALVVGQRDADPAADYQLLGALTAGAAEVLRPRIPDIAGNPFTACTVATRALLRSDDAGRARTASARGWSSPAARWSASPRLASWMPGDDSDPRSTGGRQRQSP